MSNAKELNVENFESTIANGVTLVDFWATWCGPCRALGPVIDELAADFAGKANICKVDCDQNRDIASKYGVTSIPAVFIIKNGQVVEQFKGVLPKSVFAEAINKNL